MIGVYNYTVLLTYISFLSGLTGIYFAVNGNTFSDIQKTQIILLNLILYNYITFF